MTQNQRKISWMPHHRRHLALTAILIAQLGAMGAAQAAMIAKNPDLGCTSPATLQALRSDPLGPEALLDRSLQRHTVEYGAGASLAGLEHTLTRYYGLTASFKSLITNETEFSSLSRIAVLIQNKYVVAGQMALGAAMPAKTLPPLTVMPLYNFIAYVHEPYHEVEELTDVAAKVVKANGQLGAMSEKPRAFARWVVRAGAYDDPVALDAAMLGFCQSKPTENDARLLKQVYHTAKLDWSKGYQDPRLSAGAVTPEDPFLHKSQKP